MKLQPNGCREKTSKRAIKTFAHLRASAPVFDLFPSSVSAHLCPHQPWAFPRLRPRQTLKELEPWSAETSCQAGGEKVQSQHGLKLSITDTRPDLGRGSQKLKAAGGEDPRESD